MNSSPKVHYRPSALAKGLFASTGVSWKGSCWRTVGLSLINPIIHYTTRPGTTPEGELDALTAIYKFVLFGSQASKGGPHDLTNASTSKTVKNGPRKTEQEKP
jgi:hypothetical protein